MAQDDVETRRREGLSTAQRKELIQLRRENRTLVMDIEILRRATAYFAFVSPRSAAGDLIAERYDVGYWKAALPSVGASL